MVRTLAALAASRSFAIILVGVALAAFVVQTRGYEILGMDSYPVIASGVLRSPADVVAIFTSPAVPGRVPYAFHGFYRPITTISLGFDHLLFGLEPQGYFLHQALLFGACAIALYALARRLLGARAVLGPLIALLVFLLVPSHVETLAVVARRSELLCGLAGMLALLTQDTRGERLPLWRMVLPAFFTLLALISKTTGLAILPTVFVMVLTQTPRSGLGARLRHAVLATLPHVVAVAIAFAIQVAILGQMGGHIMSRSSGAVDRLPWALGGLAWWLFVPQPALRHSYVTWTLLVALGLGLAVVVALLLRGRDRALAERLAPALSAGAVGAIWLLSIASLYGAVGLLQGWYVLVPALGFALVCGALAEALAVCARSDLAGLRPAAAATLALAALWIGWQARYSMLVRPYTQLDRASELTRGYVADLAARIAAAPDGGTIVVPAPPRKISPGPDELTLDGPLLVPEYAYQSWADSAFRDRRVEIHDRRQPLVKEASPGSVTVVFAP